MRATVENAAIARLLGEIADLLEIRADNPFKIRAYRNAAETIAAEPARVADLAEPALRELPGIGKDLSQRILEIAATGDTPYRQELAAAFPPSLLELLRLQGVGPKTVKRLFEELAVASLDQLEAAARDGRIRAMKGMGIRKEALILKAIEERRQYAGRHLAADVADVAQQIIASLEGVHAGAEFIAVGSLRRGVETCGDLDILAVGAPPDVMDTFTGQPDVVRVLGRGGTKSSVLLANNLQADLRLVDPASRGAALQYFTGSKAHNIALRDRAIARGLKLNEYGLFRVDSGASVAGPSEDGIYAELGLDLVPPELREDRGEVQAAERHTLPRLVTRADLRGDLHLHTTATDGKDDIQTMALAAREVGLEYLAITDHSKALAMAGGLDEAGALAHAARIREIGGRLDGITLLAGIECDIRLDGTLDLDNDCLAALDFVVASVHSGFSLEPEALTARLLRALECPWVDALGHATGRMLLRREPLKFDVERVLDAAAAHGVAIEINSQVHRLDVSDIVARRAIDKGARLIISSDAHSTHEFSVLDWGIRVARRAWATPDVILNTRSLDDLRASLRRHRGGQRPR